MEVWGFWEDGEGLVRVDERYQGEDLEDGEGVERWECCEGGESWEAWENGVL